MSALFRRLVAVGLLYIAVRHVIILVIHSSKNALRWNLLGESRRAGGLTSD